MSRAQRTSSRARLIAANIAKLAEPLRKAVVDVSAGWIIVSRNKDMHLMEATQDALGAKMATAAQKFLWFSRIGGREIERDDDLLNKNPVWAQLDDVVQVRNLLEFDEEGFSPVAVWRARSAETRGPTDD